MRFEIVRQNGAFFENLFAHERTIPMANQLLPVLRSLLIHTEFAIDKFSALKQATSSQFSGDQSHSKKHEHQV